MRFYLGIANPAWLADAKVPTLIAAPAIGKKAAPLAAGPWALDSGAYSELRAHGRWRTGPEEFIARVRGLIEQIGEPDFVGIQDWLCAPPLLAKTGLDVAEHQRRTVASYLALTELAPDVPWLPTLQGWEPRDYLEHAERYAERDVDLYAHELVGIGSISARQGNPEVGQVIRHLASRGMALHGFGVKKTGLGMYADALAAADSAAWSVFARYAGPDRARATGSGRLAIRMTPECEAEYQAGEHAATCAGCLRYALVWRREVLAFIAERQGAADHASLFTPDDDIATMGTPRRITRANVAKWPASEQMGFEL